MADAMTDTQVGAVSPEREAEISVTPTQMATLCRLAAKSLPRGTVAPAALLDAADCIEEMGTLLTTARAELRDARMECERLRAEVARQQAIIGALMPGDAGRWSAACPTCNCVGSVDPERE